MLPLLTLLLRSLLPLHTLLRALTSLARGLSMSAIPEDDVGSVGVMPPRTKIRTVSSRNPIVALSPAARRTLPVLRSPRGRAPTRPRRVGPHPAPLPSVPRLALALVVTRAAVRLVPGPMIGVTLLRLGIDVSPVGVIPRRDMAATNPVEGPGAPGGLRHVRRARRSGTTVGGARTIGVGLLASAMVAVVAIRRLRRIDGPPMTSWRLRFDVARTRRAPSCFCCSFDPRVSARARLVLVAIRFSPFIGISLDAIVFCDAPRARCSSLMCARAKGVQWGLCPRGAQ